MFDADPPGHELVGPIEVATASHHRQPEPPQRRHRWHHERGRDIADRTGATQGLRLPLFGGERRQGLGHDSAFLGDVSEEGIVRLGGHGCCYRVRCGGTGSSRLSAARLPSTVKPMGRRAVERSESGEQLDEKKRGSVVDAIGNASPRAPSTAMSPRSPREPNRTELRLGRGWNPRRDGAAAGARRASRSPPRFACRADVRTVGCSRSPVDRDEGLRIRQSGATGCPKCSCLRVLVADGVNVMTSKTPNLDALPIVVDDMEASPGCGR